MGKVSPQKLWVIKPGILGYENAWFFQIGLKKARLEGRIDDTLLLLQHPPTITLGRRGKEENLLVKQEELQKKGIKLFYTDRGGDITYHGPGQLVGYPIMNLRDHGLSVGQYVKLLEEVVLLTLKYLRIIAKRLTCTIGVWVGEKKIASLGVRVSRGITTHGFALNVNNDLTPFQFINPCGMENLKVTSLREILGGEVDQDFIENIVAENFSQVFRMRIREISYLDLRASPPI